MGNRLLVADGESVFVLEPHESNWVSRVTLRDAGAECIAVSSSDGQRVFVGCRGHGVQRSIDGGVTFEKLDFPPPDVFSIHLSPADGSVYAGCEPSMLFRSRDDGETWKELESLRRLPAAANWRFPLRPWTHHVRGIAASPHDPHLILVAIERGGLMRSADDGVTWEHVARGIDDDCHGVAWHPVVADRGYAVAGGGSAWSHDGGRTWLRVDAGRDDEGRHYLNGLAVDPQDPDRWYVSAARTAALAHRPGPSHAAIYRWSGGGPWVRLAGGLPESFDSFPYALAITLGALYAGLEDGCIWMGTDGAERWRELDVHGDPVRRVRALAVISG